RVLKTQEWPGKAAKSEKKRNRSGIYKFDSAGHRISDCRRRLKSREYSKGRCAAGAVAITVSFANIKAIPCAVAIRL
ncbi:MAG: hypothetical protein ACK5ES_18685, partial [Planctomyces sp.]